MTCVLTGAVTRDGAVCAGNLVTICPKGVGVGWGGGAMPSKRNSTGVKLCHYQWGISLYLFWDYNDINMLQDTKLFCNYRHKGTAHNLLFL